MDLGDLYDYDIWLSFAGLVLIGTLIYHDIQGSILIGILLLLPLLLPLLLLIILIIIL